MSASASVGLLVCEPNSSTSTPVMRPNTPTQAEGATDDAKDLLRQLQEKDRRIQFLEVKIQQLTQVRNINNVKTCKLCSRMRQQSWRNIRS